MDAMLFALLNGTIYGLLLSTGSAGLTLIFGMMGVLNFAHPRHVATIATRLHG